MSWREFILGIGLHTAEEIESAGFRKYWAESARRIPDKRDLSAYWRGILSEGDFLGTTPSYTVIIDLMLRLYHRLITCSIAGRSQAPEKVTVTDLFYLRGMDVDSVNIPCLLDWYLRRFDSGRKHRAMISRGQFVARLAEHFGICDELDDTWAWVASGLERQPNIAAGALEYAEQRDVLDSMACNFSRFTTWTVTSLSLMIDRSGVRYTSYSDYRIPYQRRTRHRSDDASTSAQQQPDP
ncbi:hypothetical protein Tco_1041672 [Tanacetum coccineum]|uniref:Uncharacterized protein n=1 Tax=Tanacetum coccineum TaxID=301880 RepID=A0ABQ5GJ79_9ASTR